MSLSLTLLFHLHHLTEAEKSSPLAYAEVLDLVRLADTLPLEAAWFAEHHLSPTRGRLPAPLLMTVAAARETARIRLGPCVLVLPLHQPLDLAEQIATADLLSGGRLNVGVGSGGNPEEFALYGIPLEQRRGRYAEGLEMLGHALSGERFSYSGEYYATQQAMVMPRPVQSPRDMLWVAASSLQSAELAGRSGGHLLLSRGMPIPDLVEQIDVYRSNRNRDNPGSNPTGASIQVTRGIYVAETEQAAWRDAEEGIRRHYKTMARYGGEPVDIGEMARRGDFIIGTPAQCAVQIAALAAQVSITHLACDISLLGMPHEMVTRSLELLGHDVTAALAGL